MPRGYIRTKPTYGKYDDAVIRFVNEFWRSNYVSPTLQEIMDGCGISSKCVAQCAVKRVGKKNGWRLIPGGQRSITPSWVIQALQK